MLHQEGLHRLFKFSTGAVDNIEVIHSLCDGSDSTRSGVGSRNVCVHTRYDRGVVRRRPASLKDAAYPKHRIWRSSREQAHVPTEQPSSFQDSRFPAADAHPRRPGDCRRPSSPGSRASDGLISFVSGIAMLPAARRIRRGVEFAAVLKRGKRARRGAVVVHTARRENGPAAGGSRAGFVVSKAVGGAVVRNRVKRRLRDVAAERMDAWPSNCDVVIRALPEAATAPRSRLAQDVDAAVASIARKR